MEINVTINFLTCYVVDKNDNSNFLPLSWFSEKHNRRQLL